jgi:hypothetical protein
VFRLAPIDSGEITLVLIEIVIGINPERPLPRYG